MTVQAGVHATRQLVECMQETKLLQSIDRMQGEADVVRREQKVAQALSQMAHPKSWPLSNGGLLQVHTPATTK